MDNFTKNNLSDIKNISENLYSKNDGPIKPIWDRVLALGKLIKDPKAAIWAKTIAIGALVYLISPIDAIPDVIMPVGLLDDAAVVTSAIVSIGASIENYLKKK